MISYVPHTSPSGGKDVAMRFQIKRKEEKQMKYYSEALDEMFDSQEELEKQEQLVLEAMGDGDLDEEETKVAEDSIKESEEEKSQTKKELADAVEKANENLKEAYALYDVDQKKISEISAKYLEEIDTIKNNALKRIADAEKQKYEAIRAFNDKYGAYKKVYTGAIAAEEFDRVFKLFFQPKIKSFDWFDRFFNF